MTKIAVLIITLVLVMSGLTVFTTKANAAPEKSLFQIVHDSIKEASQAREKKTWEDPIQKTYPIFEELKAGLESLDEKSARAKNLSLRNNKEEVLKRRSIK